jgi:hypothetical protein
MLINLKRTEPTNQNTCTIIVLFLSISGNGSGVSPVTRYNEKKQTITNRRFVAKR